jgi:hypothetical protein
MSTPADERLKSLIKLPVPIYGAGAGLFLGTVRKAFALDGLAEMDIVDVVFEGGDTLLYLSFSREVLVEGEELGEASGYFAKLGGSITLRFDSSGSLSTYELEDVSEESIEEGKAGLVKMLKEGRVYFAQPGEPVDISRLIRRKQEFYVQVDADGRKRLHRTYM